jgi:hypothetical protein
MNKLTAYRYGIVRRRWRRNPHRNHHFSGSEMGANGFRGRVSQVRILPGPLSLRVLHEPLSQERGGGSQLFCI